MMLRYFFLFVFLLFRGDEIVASLGKSSGQSGSNRKLEVPGCTGEDLVIYPKRNIFMSVNKKEQILCRVNSHSNRSSETIFFTKSLKKLRPISSEKLSNTSIRAFVQEKETKKMRLYCTDANGDQMCSRQVFIGYPPLDVENFHCISLNWRRLQCAYDLKENYVQLKTDDYHLCYRSLETNGCVTGRKCPHNDADCCKLKGSECWTWGISRDYYYDKISKILMFTISSRNALGARKYNHILDHYSAVVPNRPLGFKARVLSSKEVLLSFRLPLFMKSFPPGVIYRIEYRVFQESHFILGRSSGESLIELELELPWPGQNYSFSLSLKSGSEETSQLSSFDDDLFWSETSSIFATLEAIPPPRPPRTAPGAFQIADFGSNKRSITVAWEALDDKMKGGPNFGYDVRVRTDGGSFHLNPSDVTEYYAILENASRNTDYEFCISAVNREGSSNCSLIHVVASQDLPATIHFPLILYHRDHDVIEMRWFPQYSEPLQYTLFWCTDGSPFSQDPCQGTLKWKQVGSVTHLNVSYSDLSLSSDSNPANVRFAVSATSGGDDSLDAVAGGMTWSACPTEVYSDAILEPPPTPRVNTRDPLAVRIEWDFHCKHWAGRMTSIEVAWCLGVHNQSSQCDGDLKSEMVPLWPPSYILNELKQMTNYTVWIEANFLFGISEVSPPTSFTTGKLALGAGMIALSTLLSTAAVVLFFYVLLTSKRRVSTYFLQVRKEIIIPEMIIRPKKDAPGYKGPSFHSLSSQNTNEMTEESSQSAKGINCEERTHQYIFAVSTQDKEKDDKSNNSDSDKNASEIEALVSLCKATTNQNSGDEFMGRISKSVGSKSANENLDQSNLGNRTCNEENQLLGDERRNECDPVSHSYIFGSALGGDFAEKRNSENGKSVFEAEAPLSLCISPGYLSATQNLQMISRPIDLNKKKERFSEDTLDRRGCNGSIDETLSDFNQKPQSSIFESLNPDNVWEEKNSGIIENPSTFTTQNMASSDLKCNSEYIPIDHWPVDSIAKCEFPLQDNFYDYSLSNDEKIDEKLHEFEFRSQGYIFAGPFLNEDTEGINLVTRDNHLTEAPKAKESTTTDLKPTTGYAPIYHSPLKFIQ